MNEEKNQEKGVTPKQHREQTLLEFASANINFKGPRRQNDSTPNKYHDNLSIRRITFGPKIRLATKKRRKKWKAFSFSPSKCQRFRAIRGNISLSLSVPSALLLLVRYLAHLSQPVSRGSKRILQLEDFDLNGSVATSVIVAVKQWDIVEIEQCSFEQGPKGGAAIDIPVVPSPEP